MRYILSTTKINWSLLNAVYQRRDSKNETSRGIPSSETFFVFDISYYAHDTLWTLYTLILKKKPVPAYDTGTCVVIVTYSS